MDPASLAKIKKFHIFDYTQGHIPVDLSLYRPTGGHTKHWPENKNPLPGPWWKLDYTLEDETDTNFLLCLSKEFNARADLVADFGGTVLFDVSAPHGFARMKHGETRTKAIFGHPGGRYLAVRSFVDHVAAVMGVGNRNLDNCECAPCKNVRKRR